MGAANVDTVVALDGFGVGLTLKKPSMLVRAQDAF